MIATITLYIICLKAKGVIEKDVNALETIWNSTNGANWIQPWDTSVFKYGNVILI